MVCKGFGNNEDDIAVSCEPASRKFHGTPVTEEGMASGALGRWGRRKQANPKRTNVDEDPGVVDSALLESGSCDLQAAGSPDTPVPSDGDVTLATDRDHPTPPPEAVVDGNAPSDTDMVPQDSTALPPQQNEITKLPEESPLEITEPAVNGVHDNRAVSMDTEPVALDTEPVTMETEAEKIQELMSRSDTAVIYPEPVSDQEEGTATTENDEVCEDEEDSAPCPHCERTFSSLDLLRDHWHGTHAAHSSKHACPQCAICFPSKTNLDKHLAMHSPAAQLCKICRKTFANVYRLQRHMISHEESSELRKFKCPECGKAFKFKHHLKEHIRIHSGEKPFECQNCGKRFSHSGSYSSHMTSKKCWIVNMKMRGSSPGIQSPERAAEKGTRPLVTKDNGLDMSIASMMYNSGLLPQQLIPFDPTVAATQIQNQFMPQFTAGQHPFLPHLPFPANPLTNPVFPTIANMEAFGCLPPTGAVEKMSGSLSESAAAATKSDRQVKTVQEVVDENQNKEVKVNEAEAKVKKEDIKVPEKSIELKKETSSEDSKDAAVKEEMQAINKVLEIVGATVSQQKQNKEEKAAYSKLTDSKRAASEDESRTLTALASAATQQLQQLMKENRSDGEMEATSDKAEDEGDQSILENSAENKLPNQHPCKFCKKVFSSPIHLHQHERYLCKQNHEIQRLDTDSGLHGNGLVSPSNDDDHSTDSERKIRVRSMITDEQVQVLKTFYIANQRPNKYELESLAKQIGFPKRVVQVWFQNMRARDRRKGRSFNLGEVNDAKVSTQSSTTYIPIVPQVAMPSAMSQPNYYPSSTANSPSMGTSGVSPQRAAEGTSSADQPLDLTVKRPAAHTNKPFSTQPDQDDSEEALNLSIKEGSDSSLASPSNPTENPPTEKSTTPTPLTVKTEVSKEDRTHRASPLIVPTVSNSLPLLAMSLPLHINTTPAHSRTYASMAASLQTANFSTQPAPAHHAMPSRLQYDAPTLSPAAPDLLSPAPSSLDNSFNSTASLDSAGSPFSLLHKPKRARKKSWRQVGSSMAAEEMYDLDESVDEDGEIGGVARKKRRSWKQHRVDLAEGLYACDQCDKMFSKQSSLARHKYEHSGQRPFPCDICTKAFKHKHHLTEHKRLHSGEKPFQCQKCGKRFSHSGSYSQHMNHRYKYCKPLCGDGTDNCDSGQEVEMEHSQSEASP